MLSVKRPQPDAAVPTELSALRDTVAVLSEVVGHLAERVELLETRASLGRQRIADV